MMRHVLAALFLPLLLVMLLLCPARAMAATGGQELELASSLVAMPRTRMSSVCSRASGSERRAGSSRARRRRRPWHRDAIIS